MSRNCPQCLGSGWIQRVEHHSGISRVHRCPNGCVSRRPSLTAAIGRGLWQLAKWTGRSLRQQCWPR